MYIFPLIVLLLFAEVFTMNWHNTMIVVIT